MSVETLPPRYLTAAEATTIVAANLPANSHERIAFDALSDAGKDRVIAMASADLDAVPMIGVPRSCDQAQNWPRVSERDLTLIDPDLDEISGDWSVEWLPRNFRVAVALLAANRASAEAGTSPLAHVHEAASAGVTSQGGRGHSESYSAAAHGVWASLPARVQHLLNSYRRLGGTLA